MATQEEKELRQKVLEDIRRKRAAAAQAEGSLGAAERGDYGDVGQGERGDFDDEIEQGRGSEDPTVSAFSPSDIQELTPVLDTVSPLDLSNKGIAALMRKRIPLLVAADFVSSQIPKATKEALSETLNKPLFPGLSSKIKEALGFEQKAVTDTGEILNMKADDLEGLFVKGAKGQKLAEDILKEENVVKILEDARTGKITEVQAALAIQKIFPGSGMIKTDSKVAGGFGTTPKFRDDVFGSYVFNKNADDIFEQELKTYKGVTMKRITKGNILKAKKIADEDVSDLDYSIKFRNALSNFFTPKFKEKTFSPANNVFYDTHDLQQIENAKTIFKFLGEEPSILDMVTKTGETSGFNLFKKIKINSKKPVAGEARNYFKANVVFDDTGKTFRQVQSSLLKKNKFVESKLQQIKKLHTNASTVKPYELDHIQPPRFGGTNAESNLQLLTKGEHVNLKNLPQFKTDAFTPVKNKTNFENEFFNKSVKIVDLIKKGDTEQALKLSSELDTLVNGFKNTYKNINFKVGEPHFPYKTGKKSGQYKKYSEELNLSKEQKKLVDELLNKKEYSNLVNAGKTIEQQADEILSAYQQISLVVPGGKIPSKPMKLAGDIDVKSMNVPLPKEIAVGTSFSRMRDGGIVGMNYMTRPLNAQR